jgi:hypothetical protein
MLLIGLAFIAFPLGIVIDLILRKFFNYEEAHLVPAGSEGEGEKTKTD